MKKSIPVEIVEVSPEKLLEIENSQYLIINGKTYIERNHAEELMVDFYKLQIIKEDQNQLFRKAIELFDKSEDTQDGIDLVMQHFTIQRKA